MTGSSSPDIRRRALELGASSVLNKPLDEDELIAAICRATGGACADRQ
jgi:CheY-like chemotaxis protein